MIGTLGTLNIYLHFFSTFISLETPLSLQSACRLVIRKALGVFNLDKIDQLEIPPPFDQFIAFREFFISSAGQPGLFETNLVAISKVSRALKEVTKDLPTRKRYAKCKGLALKVRIFKKKFIAERKFLWPINIINCLFTF